jgi:hypothetical protein
MTDRIELYRRRTRRISGAHQSVHRRREVALAGQVHGERTGLDCTLNSTGRDDSFAQALQTGTRFHSGELNALATPAASNPDVGSEAFGLRSQIGGSKGVPRPPPETALLRAALQLHWFAPCAAVDSALVAFRTRD